MKAEVGARATIYFARNKIFDLFINLIIMILRKLKEGEIRSVGKVKNLCLYLE